LTLSLVHSLEELENTHRSVRSESCSFDPNAGDLDVSVHVHVFEKVVAESVGEAHHGAFWEFDVEGVVVEGDGQLLEVRLKTLLNVTIILK